QIDHQSITDSPDWARSRDWNVQAIVGMAGERGNLMIAASWLDRSELPMFARDFTFAGGLSGFGSPGPVFTVQGEDESDEAYAARRAAFEATTLDPNIPGGADLDCANVPHAQGSGKDNGRR